MKNTLGYSAATLLVLFPLQGLTQDGAEASLKFSGGMAVAPDYQGASDYHDFAGYHDRTAGGQAQDFLIVIGKSITNNGLYRIKAGTVIDGEERKASFRISAGTHPSAHGDFAVNGNAALEYVGYRHNAHNSLSC